MTFSTFDYRGKPVIIWKPQESWESTQGQQGWIKLEDKIIVLHPPADPTKSSGSWNLLKISTCCNHMLNNGKIINLIERQLRQFRQLSSAEQFDPARVQLSMSYDPRRGEWFPHVSCDTPGISSLRFELHGSVVAVGIGDPPS